MKRLMQETIDHLNGGHKPDHVVAFGMPIEDMTRDELLACLRYNVRQVTKLRAEAHERTRSLVPS